MKIIDVIFFHLKASFKIPVKLGCYIYDTVFWDENNIFYDYDIV